ncbi:hypothetical protein HDE80_002509 [Rhodanobacter sp. A1T4]|nr:hypothetical protein [Rhodanobacter sp. A1T4]
MTGVCIDRVLARSAMQHVAASDTALVAAQQG